MGQYHKTVNLTKREYIDPHKLGMGLKLREQTWSRFAQAMVPLLAVSNGRGGGDFNDVSPSGAAAKIIGRWGGDRIAIVGDYAESGDLPDDNAPDIYRLCGGPTGDEEEPFTDITDMLCFFIEEQWDGVFYGSGWRHFVEVGPCERWNPNGDRTRQKGNVTKASRAEGITIEWEDGTTSRCTARQLLRGEEPLPYIFQ